MSKTLYMLGLLSVAAATLIVVLLYVSYKEQLPTPPVNVYDARMLVAPTPMPLLGEVCIRRYARTHQVRNS